jgi:hypothetical protein
MVENKPKKVRAMSIPIQCRPAKSTKTMVMTFLLIQRLRGYVSAIWPSGFP